MKDNPVKVGDLISVYGNTPARVIAVAYEPVTKRTVIHLDWGKGRMSKVFLHDEGKIWYRYSESN